MSYHNDRLTSTRVSGNAKFSSSCLFSAIFCLQVKSRPPSLKCL